MIGNNECNDGNRVTQCQFDGGDCCTDVLIGNGICTDVNNFPTCQNYDGGDCRPPNITDWPECPHNPALIGDGTCDDHLKIKVECNHDYPDCCEYYESVGNGECDYTSHTSECNFDGGDCSECMTNGGASPNTKCIFPFIFNRQSINTCTKIDGSDIAWCSTLVDDNGNHVGEQGKWGNCGPGCPIPPDNSTWICSRWFIAMEMGRIWQWC